LRLDLSLLHTAHHSPDENLRQALAVAEAMAPVVLWIDEMDKAFGTAGTAGGASEAGARVFGSLLTWLGEQRRGVFVAATANRLTHLPAELLRKGRFDETFFVDVPDQQARAEILAAALVRSGRGAESFELERLALASDRLTGAEIDQAVSEALQVAFCAHRELRSADIETVLSKIVPFVETYDSQVRELRQWARRHCRPASRDRSLHELFAAARGSATSPPRPGQR
jgi:SpoVK/Ycf46/Vps4 family AAA+-type ATPase